MWITLAFAVGVIAMLAVSVRASLTARVWALVVALIWIVSRIVGYGLHRDLSLMIGLWLDFSLALSALFSFMMVGRRWWELGLALTWITQVFAHWDFDGDMSTMGLWLNVLAALQLVLVCSDRPFSILHDWIEMRSRWMRRSHSRWASASRRSVRLLGGPDCRAGAVRRHRET